jgi:hypothetical protein
MARYDGIDGTANRAWAFLVKYRMKLSVIIANYNYQDFVGATIESALSINWPEKEVIISSLQSARLPERAGTSPGQ